MAEFLHRVGRWCAGHAGVVIAVWAVLLAGAGGAYALFGGTLSDSFSIPGTPTEETTDHLEEAIPEAAGGTGYIVASTTDGEPFSDEQRDEISSLVAQASDVDGVANVVDPFAAQADRAEREAELEQGRDEIQQAREELEQARAQIEQSRAELEAAQQQLDAAREQAEADGTADERAGEFEARQSEIDQGLEELETRASELDTRAAELEQESAQLEHGATLLELSEGTTNVSDDGTTAIVNVSFTRPQLEVTPETKSAVTDVFENNPIEGVEVDYSSELADPLPSLVGTAEIVGLAVAAIVLFIMLGTLIGAGLPVLTALVGVGVSLLTTMSLSGVVEMATVTPILGLMLGLAVGIDYSLFIVNRHRRQLKEGYTVDESIALAIGTSGNAVVFAGTTVLIALLALNVTGIPFLGLMGSVGALSIATAVLVAVTFIPALLSLTGPRILSRKERSAGQGNGPGTAERAPAPMRTGPAVVRVLVAVGVLVTIAIPVTDMRLNLPTGASEPHDSTEYQAYTTIAEKFGEGRNGPLLVVADLTGSPGESELRAAQGEIAQVLADQEHVSAVALIGSSSDRTTTAFQVVPEAGPTSRSTEQLVRTLRDTSVEGVEQLGVAGTASGNIDMSDKLADALPIYLAFVVGLSLIILILVFRSILLPLLATTGFVLSYLAALGGVVAIYQWGWLSAVFGVDSPGPVLNFLPTVVVGILFGLAMDYMLFIGSGMREAYAHGIAARSAVVQGLRAGRVVVTAAAIIMISVFGSFMFSHVTMIRPIGFALAFGVLIDAFLVRMLIIPALLHLLDDKVWWLPSWLDRLLPDADVEGAALERRHPHREPAERARE